MTKDSQHIIWQSAKRFFSGTLLSRIAGMLRDMAMAYAFGTQSTVAAFMLAFRFAHILRRLFGEGALQSVFIPEFEALRHQSPSRAFLFFRDLYAALSLFLIILIVLGGAALGWILVNGQLQAGNQEIIFLTILMLPSLIFICLYGLNASLLQCEKIFFIPSVAPVAFNMIWILAVLAIKFFDIQPAMPWLATAVILACLAQWLATVPLTLKSLKSNIEKPIWQGVSILSTDTKKLMKPLLLGIAGVAASQMNNAIDSIFARYAESEGPAFLWYAIRIQQLPLALFGIAIAGAALPPISRSIKSSQHAQYEELLNYAIKNTLTLMIPLTFALMALAESSVAVLYGRGYFDSESIAGTTNCLWGYGLGLVPSALVLLFAPICYAKGDYRTPAYASFITMALNTSLNAVFIIGYELGALSVALATSISAWCNLWLLTWVIAKKDGKHPFQHLFGPIAKISLSSLLACLGVFAWRYYTTDKFISVVFLNVWSIEPPTFFSQLIQFVLQASVFSFIFFAVMFILGTRDAFIKQKKNEKATIF